MTVGGSFGAARSTTRSDSGTPATALVSGPIYISYREGVYARGMRRINVYMDDELDRRAEREARRRGISKAALIRRSLLAELGPPGNPDPVDDLVGLSGAEPAEDVDTVVYGG